MLNIVMKDASIITMATKREQIFSTISLQIKTTKFPNLSNDGKLFFSPSFARASMVKLLALINDFHQKHFDFKLNIACLATPQKSQDILIFLGPSAS